MTTQYATVAQVKERLGIDDTTDDTILGLVLDGVSRLIDGHCNRRFYVTAADETRYFTARMADRLWPGDVVSITTLSTDDDGDRTYEHTWTTGDYDLLPWNAALDERPYTEIAVSPDGDYSFPAGAAKGTKIVGKFGWPEVPDVVREACLIQCARLFKRKDSPFGLAGAPEMGQLTVIPRLDPDVKVLLDPVRRIQFGE